MKLNEIELESFAKINLHLDITGKYDNGFHELYSVFQLISLSDQINIKINNKDSAFKEKIVIIGDFNCAAEDNLIYKIISDFEKETALDNSYLITVDKNIPDGGGMGGGSSNAAFVLYNINKMHGSPLNREKLLEIAEKNGSDIPFFLKAVTALVKGRGENVSQLKSDLSAYDLVVACPDFKISTKDAYNLFDDNNGSEYTSLDYDTDELEKLLDEKPDKWGFFNSFTNVLKDREPVFNDIFHIMKKSGSEYYNITGSGSAVYGIFSSSKNAETAEKKLKTQFPFVWNGKMLAGTPLLEN